MKYYLLIAFFSYITTCFAQKQSIEQAEYFIDSDPGEGYGIPLQLVNFGDATIKITWHDLPPLKFNQHFYLRVKSSGLLNISGVWSFPMLVKFPTTETLKAVEAKIIRPSQSYPLSLAAWATDGILDGVVDSIRAVISEDSLMIGDTIMFRLQGNCDLWSEWTQIPITEKTFLSVDENIFSLKNNIISIYPNPVQDKLFIETSENKKIGKVNIYNILGINIWSGEFYSSNCSIPIDNVPSGIYFVNVQNKSEMFIKN